MNIRGKIKKGFRKVFREAKAKKVKTIFDEFKQDQDKVIDEESPQIRL